MVICEIRRFITLNQQTEKQNRKFNEDRTIVLNK